MEGVGGGGAKPEGSERGGGGHQEPWSCADPCASSLPPWSHTQALTLPRPEALALPRPEGLALPTAAGMVIPGTLPSGPPGPERVSASVSVTALRRRLLFGLHQLSGVAGRWGRLIPELLEPGLGRRAPQ